MNKFTNCIFRKVVSLCLCASLLMSIITIPPLTVCAAENSFEKVSLALNSDEVSESVVDLYVYKSEYYITINDLCALTRSSYSEEEGLIVVNQGFWSGKFDVEKQLFDDTVQSVNITILEVKKGVYAVPAIMFLNYYRATAWISQDTLYCRMPECTPWEAMDIDFSNTLINIYELYGSEERINFALTCDILNDFLMGNTMDVSVYMDDAINSALSINMFEYEAVQQYIEEINSNLHQDINSNKGIAFLEELENDWPLVKHAVEWFVDNYYDAMAKSFAQQAYNAFQVGDTSAFSEYSEDLYEILVQKNRTNGELDDFFTNAEYIAVFVSAAVDTTQEIKYTKATNNIVYKVLGTDNLRKYSLYEKWNKWGVQADNYQNWNRLAADNVEQAALDYYTGAYETLVSTFIDVASNSSYGGAVTFGLALSRRILELYPSNKAFKAELNALFLTELQSMLVDVLIEILERIQENPNQSELYSEYILALQLYCRISIALYENLIVSVDTFQVNADDCITLFQSRADLLAVYLYRLTKILDGDMNTCLPLDLSTFEFKKVAEKRLTQVNIYENGSLFSEQYFTYNEAGLISEIKSYYYPDDGYGNKESTTTLIYDSENRLTSKSSFVPGAATGYYAMYTYNEAGQLASSDSRDGGHVTYEYSADGKLIRDVRSLPVGTPATSEYIYDNNGLLAEIRTTDGGGTYSLRYTYNQDGQIAETKLDVYTDIYCYDYKLFELITTKSMYINETTARILDVMDHEVYNYTFIDPEFITDDEGYIVKVTDRTENRVYEFQYSNR